MYQVLKKFNEPLTTVEILEFLNNSGMDLKIRSVRQVLVSLVKHKEISIIGGGTKVCPFKYSLILETFKKEV